MKRILTYLVCCLLMIGCVMGTTSCLPSSFLVPNGDTSELPDVNELPDGTTVNVTGGDNYNITIEGGAPATVAAANKALLSSVSVISYYEGSNLGWGGFGGSSGSSTSRSRGSGVIYKIDKASGTAYVITNYHVLYNSTYGICDRVEVYLYGEESYANCAMTASYVGGSLAYDIAILKISANKRLMESIATAVEFADSDNVSVLDTVIAVGNAQGKGISATVGYVNVESEYLTMLGADDKTEITLRVIRTDAAVNPGNSGGGLFNDRGQIVGIVNAKNANDSVDNIGYAIAANVVRSIADNIIHYCDNTTKTCVYRCILGITVSSTDPVISYDPNTGKIHRSETVTVTAISKEAISNKIKLGDVITSITIDGNKKDILRRHQVIDSMLDAREGSVVTITFLRGGVEQSATVTVSADMIEAYK